MQDSNQTTTQAIRPFHLAFPVKDLEATRRFYCDVMGCRQGREDRTWIDFDLFGHQLSAHLRPDMQAPSNECGSVDGDAVPIPHFGVVLTMPQWRELRDRLLQREHEVRWVLRPKIRFEGEPGEQATLFILDPSGNALEFKGFNSDDGIFATG